MPAMVTAPAEAGANVQEHHMVAGARDLTSSLLDEMTHTERVMAAVRGEPVDRIPVCFWHHFKPSGSGRSLAEATFEFFDATYDLDILKIMPDIPYPFPHKSIREPDHWL